MDFLNFFFLRKSFEKITIYLIASGYLLTNFFLMKFKCLINLPKIFLTFVQKQKGKETDT